MKAKTATTKPSWEVDVQKWAVQRDAFFDDLNESIARADDAIKEIRERRELREERRLDERPLWRSA